MYSGMLLTVMMLMVPCIVGKLYICIFWHIGDCDYDDSIFIICPVMAIIGGELCILAYWWL